MGSSPFCEAFSAVPLVSAAVEIDEFCCLILVYQVVVQRDAFKGMF